MQAERQECSDNGSTFYGSNWTHRLNYKSASEFRDSTWPFVWRDEAIRLNNSCVCVCVCVRDMTLLFVLVVLWVTCSGRVEADGLITSDRQKTKTKTNLFTCSDFLTADRKKLWDDRGNAGAPDSNVVKEIPEIFHQNTVCFTAAVKMGSVSAIQITNKQTNRLCCCGVLMDFFFPPWDRSSGVLSKTSQTNARTTNG